MGVSNHEDNFITQYHEVARVSNTRTWSGLERKYEIHNAKLEIEFKTTEGIWLKLLQCNLPRKQYTKLVFIETLALFTSNKLLFAEMYLHYLLFETVCTIYSYTLSKSITTQYTVL